MGAFDAGRKLRRLLLMLALGAPSWGLAQARLESGAEARLGALAEQVRAAQVTGGPYSSELIEPLTGMALLYEDSGNHALAEAVTEQALQVIRANYGLRSLEQVPLIERRLQSERNRGNAAAAWELEHGLLSLARAQPNDLRSAAIFRYVGDQRLDLLRRYLAGEPAPEVSLGCFYKQETTDEQPFYGCSSGSQRRAARAILMSAQTNYAAAINVFRRAQLYSSEELRELEMDLIRSTYRHGGDYRTGRESYGRLIAYDMANRVPLEARLDALVQLGDWDLIYEQRPRALDVYAATYAFLVSQGLDEASIAAVFSPALPVALPAFLPNPLASSPGLEDSYIDIAFDISRYGSADRVKVLAAAPGVADEAQAALVRTVKRQQFRPQFVAGELPRSTRVVVRYYADD